MKSSRAARPLAIRKGSVSVRVYSVIRKSGPQKGAQFFQVADYSGGRRRLVSFADLDAAKTAAERVAALLARGEGYAAGFRAEDRAAHARALELLTPLAVPIEVAVADYVEAVQLLGGQRQRLVEAVRYFAERNPASLPGKTTHEVVNELLAGKKARGASARYLQDLESRLNRFCVAFQVNVANITTAQIQRWLDGLELSAQSVKNYRTLLHVFFEFCAVRGYVHRGFNPAAESEPIKVRDRDVEIFEPAEFTALLAAADEAFRPCLALQGLAGLRSNEVERLDWSHVKMAERVIVVSKGVAKTASRRTIPIGDALAEWLAPVPQVNGQIWQGSHDHFYVAQQATAAAAGVEWKHNGLRHSYASYRFALLPDAGRVAAELGHSPAILHKHYRELANREAAEAWFDVRPRASGSEPRRHQDLIP